MVRRQMIGAMELIIAHKILKWTTTKLLKYAQDSIEDAVKKSVDRVHGSLENTLEDQLREGTERHVAAYMKRGMQYVRISKYAEALADFLYASYHEKFSPVAHLWAGLLLYGSEHEHRTEAEDKIREALRLSPYVLGMLSDTLPSTPAEIEIESGPKAAKPKVWIIDLAEQSVIREVVSRWGSQAMLRFFDPGNLRRILAASLKGGRPGFYRGWAAIKAISISTTDVVVQWAWSYNLREFEETVIASFDAASGTINWSAPCPHLDLCFISDAAVVMRERCESGNYVLLDADSPKKRRKMSSEYFKLMFSPPAGELNYPSGAFQKANTRMNTADWALEGTSVSETDSTAMGASSVRGHLVRSEGSRLDRRTLHDPLFGRLIDLQVENKWFHRHLWLFPNGLPECSVNCISQITCSWNQPGESVDATSVVGSS